MLLVTFVVYSLVEEDRIGKYKSRELGFTGICCKHCGGQPGCGRYFPGSFNSFLSGKNAENMVDHIVKECEMASPQLKLIIQRLENFDKTTKARPPHGSRKKFFFHIWTRLREYNNNKEDEQSLSDLSPIPLKTSSSRSDDDTSTYNNIGMITPCDFSSNDAGKNNHLVGSIPYHSL
jgi:hypothetical protein